MDALCQREAYSPNFEGQKVQNQSAVIRVGTIFSLQAVVEDMAQDSSEEKKKGREGTSFLPSLRKVIYSWESLLSKHLLKVLSPSTITIGFKIQHVLSRGQTLKSYC